MVARIPFALVGSRNNGSNLDFHIVRLVTNGALDTSFVTTGAALISVGTADDIGLSVNLAQDGKLTISGEAGNATQDLAF